MPAARRAAALLLVVAAAAAAAAAAMAGAALSCDTVYKRLNPCLGYVQSGGTVPRACCGGIQQLMSEARTTPDRRAICTCLKNLAAGAPGAYISRAVDLPGRCGVQLPYKLSPNMNCNLIN